MTREINALREAKTLNPQQTLEPAPAEAPNSLLGTQHCRTQAGMQVGPLVCNNTCGDREINSSHILGMPSVRLQ